MPGQESICLCQDCIQIVPSSFGDLPLSPGEQGKDLSLRFRAPERLNVDKDRSGAPFPGDDGRRTGLVKTLQNGGSAVLEVGHWDNVRQLCGVRHCFSL